LRITD
jgi:hypothetical protein